ncbi:hypothetical protein SGLAM104S_01363 [Streptomyces glaucescens]
MNLQLVADLAKAVALAAQGDRLFAQGLEVVYLPLECAMGIPSGWNVGFRGRTGMVQQFEGFRWVSLLFDYELWCR